MIKTRGDFVGVALINVSQFVSVDLLLIVRYASTSTEPSFVLPREEPAVARILFCFQGQTHLQTGTSMARGLREIDREKHQNIFRTLPVV